MAWTPIRTMPRGAPPDFTLLNKPGNIYVTNAQRWFTDQLIDLEPRTVIAGWYSHKPGYHDTVEHNDARDTALGTDDYSTRDPEDRRGPRDKTRASDWTHRDAQAGNFTSMARYGDRMLAAYRATDPRLAGWREALGRVSDPVTIGGVSTRRVGIDFRHRYLRIPSQSHDWHWHFSEDTEQVESFWNKWALLTIMADWSLAEWRQSIEEDDMTPEQAKQLGELHKALIGDKHVWAGGRNAARLLVDLGYAVLHGQPGTETTWIAKQLLAIGQAAGLDPAELEQIRGALGAELAEADIPTAVVEELGAVESDQEVADRLRALLGDRAAAVGALLAA